MALGRSSSGTMSKALDKSESQGLEDSLGGVHCSATGFPRCHAMRRASPLPLGATGCPALLLNAPGCPALALDAPSYPAHLCLQR